MLKNLSEKENVKKPIDWSKGQHVIYKDENGRFAVDRTMLKPDDSLKAPF